MTVRAEQWVWRLWLRQFRDGGWGAGIEQSTSPVDDFAQLRYPHHLRS